MQDTTGLFNRIVSSEIYKRILGSDRKMIAYLKGEIVEILEDRVILEAGNIGYNFMPMAGVDAIYMQG